MDKLPANLLLKSLLKTWVIFTQSAESLLNSVAGNAFADRSKLNLRPGMSFACPAAT